MGLKEDYRLKKLKKEMHRLHCEITKCCDGEGGDGLTCEDLGNCQEIIDIKDSIPTNNSELVNDSNYLTCDDLGTCQEIIDIKESIPTNNSELVNDSNYLTCEDLENCQEIRAIQAEMQIIKLTIPRNNSELVNDSGYITCEDLENCQTIIDIKDSIPTDVSDLTDNEELLFSGDYNDLDNKPTIPTNNSELVNDSGYLACEDLENCQTIIDIKDSIPTDVSDLSDTNGILLEYKGEHSSAPLSPQKGWFYKNTVDGVMYYFDGANWIAYAEGGGGGGLTCEDLGTCQEIIDIKDSIPTNNSELVNDSNYLTCEDLENCQEIIDIKYSIPTDVSDLTDINNILLEYIGELSSVPPNPQKGWFGKNTVDGVMYYFDGTNWIAYAEGGGGDIFIERSLPDLHVDIANDELVPGATYKITGVHRAHTIGTTPVSALYDDGRDLGTTIFLKAVSESELETFGSGIFYNPKYDKQVQGFGIWSDTAPNYNVDDIVFWGGYVWKNLNGNIGSSVDILSLNGEWEKLNYDDVNYNKVVDYIEYDIENDIITRRYDTVNEIDVNSGFYDIVFLNDEMGLDFSSISLMQWGNDLYTYLDYSGGRPVRVTVGVGSIRVKHVSFAELINFKGAYIFYVTLDNGSWLENVTFDGSYLNNVTLDNQSNLTNITLDRSSLAFVTLDNQSNLTNVTFDNGSYLTNVTLDRSGFIFVTIDNGSMLFNATLDGSVLAFVTLDNGSQLHNVILDNESHLTNITLDNSNMRYNTFISFIADFSNQIYTSLDISNIKFEGNGGNQNTIPNISSATIITDSDIPQKKVFGIDFMTQKIQYWDSVSNDFVVGDITD